MDTLLGMASQIAEREDRVTVEDVLGEAEAVPAGCALLSPGWGFCWSSSVRPGGVTGQGACTLSLLRHLLTMVPSVSFWSPWGWLETGSWASGAVVAQRSLRFSAISSPDFWPGPLKFSGTDHLAGCLQRGRDLGLPSYTKAREALGLPPITRWQDINPALSQSNHTVRRGWDPEGRVGGPRHIGPRHGRKAVRHKH